MKITAFNQLKKGDAVRITRKSASVEGVFDSVTKSGSGVFIFGEGRREIVLFAELTAGWIEIDRDSERTQGH